MLFVADFQENDWPEHGAKNPDLDLALSTPSDHVQVMLDKVDELVRTEVEPREAALRKDAGPYSHLTEDGTLTPAVWEARREIQRLAADAGLYSLHLPSERGGGGFDREEMFFVEERVYQYGALLAPAILAWSEGPGPMLAHASPQLHQQFVEPLMKAETTAAFTNTEPGAGSNMFAISTTARRDGDDWLIDGSKAFVTNHAYCDVVQVNAVTGQRPDGRPELTVFMLDANSPGVRRGTTWPTIMDDGLTGALSFENVRVPDSQRLGELGDGLKLMMTMINWRRLGRAGMDSGWMRTLVERAIRYLGTREVAGGLIGRHQVPQHMLVDMYMRWYSTRETSVNIIRTVNGLGPANIPVSKEVIRLTSMVKLINDEAFFDVADAAVQLWGGRGLLKGTPEEQLFRIARNLRIPAGTVQVQRNTIAEELLK